MKFSFDTVATYLIPVSLIYLAIPYFIFFAGWLTLNWAILSILLVALPLIVICAQTRRLAISSVSSQAEISLLQFSFILIVISLLMVISGTGGIGYQDSDWKKHNALMQDLQERPWPVIYSRDGVALPLVYNIAYYLPAASLGKVTDATTAQIGLFFWTWLGMVLAVAWFLILVRKRPMVSFVIFILFSGLDVVGVGLHELLLGPPEDPWAHLEWWAQNWQFSSHVTQIFWVPQHAISGWVMSGIVAYAMLYRPTRDRYLYYLSLMPLWSPFAAVGLVPLFVVNFWPTAGTSTLLTRAKQYLSFPNICGILLLGLMGIFFLSKFFPTPLPIKQPEFGLIFHLPRAVGMPAATVFLFFVWFLVLELGVFIALIARHLPSTPPEAKKLLMGGCLFIIIIAVFRYGKNNDLVLRGAVPTLFLVAVLFTRVLIEAGISRLRRSLLISIILIGSATPLVEVWRHLDFIAQTQLIQIPQPFQVPSIIELNYLYKTRSRLIQYVGSLDSPFFTWFVNDTICQTPPGSSIMLHNQTSIDVPLSDRFTLLCSYFHLGEDTLTVNLLLQTVPVADGAEETHDTIYVHLLNDHRERVTGSDILLFKNYKDVSVSTHQLVLPPGLPSGPYFLRVGTYYFDDGQLVDVGATSIETPVVVP